MLSITHTPTTPYWPGNPAERSYHAQQPPKLSFGQHSQNPRDESLLDTWFSKPFAYLIFAVGTGFAALGDLTNEMLLTLFGGSCGIAAGIFYIGAWARKRFNTPISPEPAHAQVFREARTQIDQQSAKQQLDKLNLETILADVKKPQTLAQIQQDVQQNPPSILALHRQALQQFISAASSQNIQEINAFKKKPNKKQLKNTLHSGRPAEKRVQSANKLNPYEHVYICPSKHLIDIYQYMFLALRAGYVNRAKEIAQDLQEIVEPHARPSQ